MDQTGTFSGLAYRFRLIVDGLRKTVPEHQTKHPASCALVGVIWTSLGRRLERFERILARVAAGIPDPVRRSRACPARAAVSDTGDADEGPTKPRMPTRAGWLMIMMPWKVAPYGSQLRHWLTDPDVEAMVQSSRRMRRLLRPLLRSLSTDPLPECLLEPASEPTSEGASAALVGDAVGAGSEDGGDVADAVEPDGAEVSPAGEVRMARRPVRRKTNRAAVVRDAPACAPAAAPMLSAQSWGVGAVQAAVAPPPRDWWSVQDERRRAALAIARGSVCRG